MSGAHAIVAEREGMTDLITALGSGAARYVGGIVRDTLLGLAADDVDLATVHSPDEVLLRLQDARIRAVPTGLAHGTITAVLASGPVEVTTLRRDVATDGRHALVAFTDDWREDASRRDFTINALYADPVDGRVEDYFGGLADLAARRVRFIGDPYRRIAEDHLRILRFFRFHARFGEVIDAAGLAACAARANDLMALSRERIAAECLKLLVAPGAVAVLGTMVAHGILRAVLPEIDAASVNRLTRLAAREAEAGIAPDPIRRLSALLPGSEAAEAVGARLKLSKAQRRRLDRNAVPLASEHALELAYLFGTEAGIDLLLLSQRPISAVAPQLHDLATWQPPRLTLTGRDVIARGVMAGPAVARLLKTIERRWIDEGFPAADRVEEIADAVVAQARSAEGGAIIA